MLKDVRKYIFGRTAQKIGQASCASVESGGQVDASNEHWEEILQLVASRRRALKGAMGMLIGASPLRRAPWRASEPIPTLGRRRVGFRWKAIFQLWSVGDL
jgi:hypothetical protein